MTQAFSRQRRRPSAAALPRPGGPAPRDPLTRALGLLVVWWSVDTAVWEVGGIVVSAGLFGGWVIEDGVFWRSPMPPFTAALGGSAYSRGGLRRVRCGWRLRPKLLPPIGSSPGRMRFWFLLLCPFFFGILWAGNQVTGATGDRGCRGCEDAVGRKSSVG